MLAYQTDAQHCELQLVKMGDKLETVQRIPINGLIDSLPSMDNQHLAVTSDSGATVLFENSGNAQSPLKTIASGSVGGDALKRGTIRYTALFTRNVWIADWQLMRFEPQLAEKRLLPMKSILKDIITTAPLRREGNILFHSFRSPNSGGVKMRAVSLENENNGNVAWETEVADPIIRSEKSGNGLMVYTSGGKSYRVDINAEKKNLEKPSSKLKTESMAGSSLADVIPTQAGFAAWVLQPEQLTGDGAESRTIQIYDPSASDATRFRSNLLPSPMGTIPMVLQGNLVAPLRNGTLFLADGKDGSEKSKFSPRQTPDKNQSQWGNMVSIGNTNQFLICDTPQGNGTAAGGGTTLYHFEFKYG
jgi:hypothetical protein